MDQQQQQIDQNVARIVANLGTAPAEPGSILAASQERTAQLARTAAALQESLDSLRVSVKYLVFDLEATRRENARLRQEIEAMRRHEE